MEPLRASDADRERAAGSLTRHAQAGRLTAEELEERLERLAFVAWWLSGRRRPVSAA